MGQSWDGGDVAFRPDTWAGMKEHLFPGAFGMAFAGSRGWHRMACAIEDAGFIIHPTIFGWVYACLSSDTEILTIDGWKSYKECLTGSMVMCYNVDENKFAYMPVEETFEYDYNETAYSIKSEHTDQLVTRNHRVIVERNGKPVFEFAENLKSEDKVYIAGAPQRQDKLQPEIQTAWEYNNLSGMREASIQADGVATKSKNPNLLKEMQRKAQGNQSNCSQIRQNRHEISEFWLKGRQKSGLEGRSNIFQKARKLFTNKIRQMSGGISYYGSQRWLCYGASSIGGEGNGKMFAEGRDCASCKPQSARQRSGEFNVVFQQYSSQEIRSDWTARTDLAVVTPVNYQGKVWCVTVPTGAFVARRNGKIFVTGNSGFPKATRVRMDGEDVPEFLGHRYGLMALKPAVEPIIVFQKPYDGRPIENIIKSGAGSLNIDAGRVDSGQWPANIVISHHPDCKLVGYKDAEPYQINRWKDDAHPFGGGAGNEFESTEVNGQEAVYECVDDCACKKMGDSARFFNNPDWQIDNADGMFYVPKANKQERDAGLSEHNPHPTVKPLALNRWLASLLLPPDAYAPRRLLVPFSGVSSEMIGGLLAGWDVVEGVEMTAEYIPVAEQRLKFWSGYSGTKIDLKKIAKANQPKQEDLF